jgi:hypothetical protein
MLPYWFVGMLLAILLYTGIPTMNEGPFIMAYVVVAFAIFARDLVKLIGVAISPEEPYPTLLFTQPFFFQMFCWLIPLTVVLFIMSYVAGERHARYLRSKKRATPLKVVGGGSSS